MKITKLSLGILRFLTGTGRALFAKSHYKIKPGYRHRTTVEPYSDLGAKDEYQKEVYEKAAQIAKDNHFTKVIDIGCGSGYKLIHNLGHLDTLGVDTKETIDQVKKDYPNYDWLDIDSFNPAEHAADLIICADVLEHIADPDEFMNKITSIRDWKMLLLSTPDRDLKRGRHHFGPPQNPGHYREWNGKELEAYLSKFVKVESKEITNEEQGTQLIIGLKNHG